MSLGPAWLPRRRLPTRAPLCALAWAPPPGAGLLPVPGLAWFPRPRPSCSRSLARRACLPSSALCFCFACCPLLLPCLLLPLLPCRFLPLVAAVPAVCVGGVQYQTYRSVAAAYVVCVGGGTLTRVQYVYISILSGLSGQSHYGTRQARITGHVGPFLNREREREGGGKGEGEREREREIH